MRQRVPQYTRRFSLRVVEMTQVFDWRYRTRGGIKPVVKLQLARKFFFKRLASLIHKAL
ncbi:MULTISPECIES: hypothetical protein [unclassified Rhizobium]|uniref:hypothetical protein n=1 Tax=unclassified Rhizobium TaxID=2613769 RepID=UPI0018D7543B|nr:MULTISPECIES: hypothetical protein [unclassified Rhizobium]